jgi:hypothetical protein
MLSNLAIPLMLLISNPEDSAGVSDVGVDVNSSIDEVGINEVFLAAVDNNGKSYHWDKILPLFERENALDIKPTFYPEISIKVETQLCSRNLYFEKPCQGACCLASEQGVLQG